MNNFSRLLLPLSLVCVPGFVIGQTDQSGTEDVLLSDVNVSASRSASDEIRRNASAGKIVYGREELETLDAASIGELLGKLPGAGMFVDPDSGARGRGRGPDRNMPQILVDGQPLPGGGRNPATALRLPVELIERVEIIRNSTPEFPVLGPGGVINLVLRDVPSKQVRSAKLGLGAMSGEPGLRLEAQYGEPEGGSFGYMLSASINSRSNKGEGALDSVTYAAGVPTGTLNEQSERAGRDTNLTLSPRFSWRLDERHRFTLSPFLTYTENERNSSVDRLQSGVRSQDREHEDGKRVSGRLNGEWKRQEAGGTETSARLMLQGEYESVFRRTQRQVGLSQEKTTGREKEWMLDLRHKQLFFDKHLLTAAAELKQEHSDETQRQSGLSVASNRANLREYSEVVWVQDEWQVAGAHVLTPGLRWQSLEISLDDTQMGKVERKDISLNPSLHYLWQISPQWNFRASVARNTKAPPSPFLRPFTRAANGTNSSSNPDRGGNPALAPEKLRSVELGIEHFLAARAGTVGLSVFDRLIDDYTQRLVAFDGATGRWVERPFNVGSARLQGLSFDYKVKLLALGVPNLTFRGNLAYTDIEMLEKVAGLGAGEGPRKTANLGADYEIPSVRLTVGGNYNHVSALDRESSATVRQIQEARRQLDLYALYKIDRQISLRFSAQNVTRETRRNALEETDATGSLIRSERDWSPGVASYMLTLEAKW